MALNKTAIESCDFTLNIATGCYGPDGTPEKPRRCGYCYAQRMAKRLAGRCGYPVEDPFRPTLHPARLWAADRELARLRKPARIFMGSMTDMCADWTPPLWMAAALALACRHSRHVFQFLTKAPHNLPKWNPWPPNCWPGATIDSIGRARNTLDALAQVEASVRWVSIEPLLDDVGSGLSLWLPFQPGRGQLPFEWAVVGAMTGKRAKPVMNGWADSLSVLLRNDGVATFHKSSLKPHLNGQFRQEWPIPRPVRRYFGGWR